MGREETRSFERAVRLQLASLLINGFFLFGEAKGTPTMSFDNVVPSLARDERRLFDGLTGGNRISSYLSTVERASTDMSICPL